MGRLVQLELQDFKSYRGTQVIGPFCDFTTIIGPNGSGKSNLMDAISFVLGLNVHSLRSQNLKDLIHRSQFSALENSQGQPNRCSVALVLADDEEKRIRYCRSVTQRNVSEYSISDKTVTAEVYRKELEKYGILTQARNFLVFQGDIEMVASQSPTDLTRLLEVISKSYEYKVEYEKLKQQQERAFEERAFRFSSKRGLNNELRTWQEQKKEAENFEQKCKERDEMTVQLYLWELLKFHRKIETNKKAIKRLEIDDNSSEELEKAKKQIKELEHKNAMICKSVINYEKDISTLQKAINDQNPRLVAIESKNDLITKNISNYEARIYELKEDKENQSKTLKDVEQQLGTVIKAIELYEKDWDKKLAKTQITFNSDQQNEYKELKQKFLLETANEFSRLENLNRNLKFSKKALSTIQEKCEFVKKHIIDTKNEMQKLSKRKDVERKRINMYLHEQEQKKSQLSTLLDQIGKSNQTLSDLNEQLVSCLKQMSNADINQNENKKESEFREILFELKRIFSGVYGSVASLFSVKNKKYEAAVSSAIGIHNNSIVVNNLNTAKECIKYLTDGKKNQRTFLPLDIIFQKNLDSQLRNINRKVHLAIDLMTYEPTFERVMNMITSNSIICDDLQTAKDMVYSKNLRVKDGTIIHKSGLMTGGVNFERYNTRFEDHNYEALAQQKERLIGKIEEASNEKQKLRGEDDLRLSIQDLERNLKSSHDEMASIERSIKLVESKLNHYQNEAERCSKEEEEALSRFRKLKKEIDPLESQNKLVQDRIFTKFCKNLKIKNIREYEDNRTGLGEYDTKMASYTSQKELLRNRIYFESTRLEELEKRIKDVEKKTSEARNLQGELLDEKITITEHLEELVGAKSKINAKYDNERNLMNELQSQLSTIKKIRDTLQKDKEKKSKEKIALDIEIEKNINEIYTLLKNIRVENCQIPLEEGNLKNVPLEESSALKTDIEIMFGIKPDFEKLDSQLFRNTDESMELKIMENLANLKMEIDHMRPNMKAIDKYQMVQDRALATEQDWQRARVDAKKAINDFEQIKKKRNDLFMEAFNHISAQIDHIYKELTRSTAFPMGGTAYLALEDNNEPYNHGIKYHAMPPTKRFRYIEQLSGGEKTMAALALLFAIHSYHPSPFFILDEVDAALDNQNVAKVAQYIRNHAGYGFQFVVISLSSNFFTRSEALVGVYREQRELSSRTLTLNLSSYG